jgi:hypothetical protein
MYDRAVDTFQCLYRQAEQRAASAGRLIGREALLTLANAVERGALSDSQRGPCFALPLAVKRALDYSAFFADHHGGLRQLKQEQAAEFGACQTHITGLNWKDAAQNLRRLADNEATIKEDILRIR